ncbi:sulfotransferase family protein [Alterinioella nitratireducens]|uniref:sulfotransferase family protein n=1 Tax=Alterinioella nitratireducens TaxID=2735915 RepID=UPI004059A1E8
MGLQIIGSGFGRTGTMSTKIALEQLGFGPCHHMTEVMANPDQPPHWDALAEGREVDWADVFAGYSSQVDFPGAAVWHQLSIAFPDAKVIHTERPEEEWWASYSKTIGKFFALRETMPLPPPIAAIFETMDKLLIKDVFGGLDRESSIKAYRRNNAKVREVIPADRLLVFTPADGWEPLCRFLGVATPAGDFPRTHARDEFWQHFGGEPAMPAAE